MKDEGHIQTNKILSNVEDEVEKVYRRAAEETQKKLDNYLQKFSVKDKIKRDLLEAGKITQKEYNDWRIGQIMIGQRWEEMRDSLAQDLHNSNMIARNVVKGHTPEVYAVNHNYATFQIEKASSVNTSYTLYDRQTVERIMRDSPKMLPSPGERMKQRIASGKDVAWQRGQIQSVMTQAILQGESIPQISKRIATTMGSRNDAATTRYARTAITGAQNAGRIDAYERAEEMGIELEQEWLATLDNRTRHSHVLMDGESVPVGEKFSNGCKFPGDPDGPPEEIWNCRCTLVPRLKSVDQSLAPRHDEKLEGMSYDEWKHGHFKSYSDEEYRTSAKKWAEDMENITNHDRNVLESYICKQVELNGPVSYTYGLSRGMSMSDDELDKLQVGGVFSDGKLSSWSNRIGIAQSFSRENITKYKTNEVVIRTKEPMYHGAKLKNALPHGRYDEGEVLVSSKAKFRITNRKKSGNYIEIWVDPIQ